LPEPLPLSVVIAVYNGETRLSATIECLRRQTFLDYELIVIDDGSTDHTWDYLSGLEIPRFRAHRNIANRGQTAALNQGLALAQGRYVARHDDEDISDPKRLEKQVAFLDGHPEVALVGTQVVWIDASGELVWQFEYPTEHQAIRERLKEKNSFAHGSVMIRREALDQVGGYREAFRLAQDYDLWLRLAEQHQVANLPETLYKMRFSAQMASVARNAEQAAYAQLARQLAVERAESGEEKTSLEAAGEEIAARYTQMSALARRAEQSRNFVNWAERLLWWGEPAARYAWTMWSYALLAWPFDLRVWKFAAREARRRFQGGQGQTDHADAGKSGD
jgi:glycosyltransferase involved in cell wall biosynthesis